MNGPSGSLFCDVGLAARIERGESQLIAEGAAAAALRRPETPAFSLSIAGGQAVWAGAGSPFNKIAGWGFAGLPDPAELEALELRYAALGETLRVELASLGDPALALQLSGRGYRLVGFENVLGLGLPAAPALPPPLGVEIRPSTTEELAAWLDVVVSGFARPDTQGVPSDEEFPREVLEWAIGDLAATPGFHRYVALREGTLAAGASCRLADGIAQLCGAATLPEHRRRGIQSALLALRLADAAAAGCDLAVVTTQPGSKSQENVQRLGFSLLYTRAVLIREM